MNMNKLVNRNQSIKIVPSLEESLQNMGLNVTLDENTTSWFEQLQVTWKTWKKSPTVTHQFDLFFQTSPEPYRIALIFIIRCKEFKDCKPKSLPFFIIETLQKWSSESGSIPDDCLKLPAFRIATEQRNQHFLTMIVKTYQINTLKEKILPLVKDMVRNNNCKQASQVVIAMELYEDISVEDLLFPLILQDKNNMIDEYLSECPSQVGPLLEYLDSLLDKNFNIREYAQKFIEEYKITHVKYDRIHHKPLGKLVARLCNKFNIPIETCKNLSKNRTIGGLRYLIYQKYVDHNVSSTVWDDLVKDSLKQNSDSAKDFIDMLMVYDTKEAAKWVEYLQLPETLLPQCFQQMSLKTSVIPQESENWDQDDDSGLYYELSLPTDRVVIIDTFDKFLNLTNLCFSDYNVVSIDCEWKPSFGAAQSHVALLQIATIDHVYLIDTLILNKQECSSLWNSLNKSLLDNAEIIKLGFGLEQDLKEMKGSILGLSNIKVKGEGLLDLSILWKSLIGFGLCLQGSTSGGNSLSSLVQTCFGLPLKKSEQCSNWEIRPLRSTQIQYAALDAYVLIKLYNFFQNQCLQQGINFEEICNDVMLETKKKSTKKQKVADRILESASNLQMKRVSNVKFLVDSKLINLIPYFRHCGIDTILMSTTMLWYDIVNYAISEDRYILLGKLKYTPTKKYPQTSILEVHGDNIQEQIKHILNCFNVMIKKDDLLSRCINCNCTDLQKLTTTNVVEICKKYQYYGSGISNKSNYGNNVDEDDCYYDNFLSDSDEDEAIFYMPVQNQTENLCVTGRGVPVEIQNFHKLSTSPQPAIMCESCGRVFWDGDDLFKSVNNILLLIINS